MKKIVFALILIIFVCLPTFAAKKYYIKNDIDYDLQFLCFSEKECYSLNANIIEVKNKKFVGFGAYHYYDLGSYKHDNKTNTYSVDVLVDRDPSTDLDVCNKCPFDRGNITHLIFSLIYKPFPKKFKATYKGFVSSEDIVKYENGKPISHHINYLDIYYNNNANYIKDLKHWLNLFNKRVAKTFGKPNDYTYDTDIKYIIPHYISNKAAKNTYNVLYKNKIQNTINIEASSKIRDFDIYEPIPKNLEDEYVKKIPQNQITNFKFDLDKALKHILYDKITYNNKTLKKMLLDFDKKSNAIYLKYLHNPHNLEQNMRLIEQLKQMSGTISFYPDAIIEQVQPYIVKYDLGLEPGAESDTFLYKYYIEKYHLKYSKEFKELLELKEYVYSKLDIIISKISNEF